MLTAEQRAGFEGRGFVRLPGAVDACVASSLHERVHAFLAERGLVPDSPEPGFSVTSSVTAAVVEALGFEEVWGTRVVEVIDEILGPGTWHRPKHSGQLLALAYPVRGAVWLLPHKVWHLDYPAPGALRRLPGLQLFLCVDRIDSRGGATLAIAASTA